MRDGGIEQKAVETASVVAAKAFGAGKDSVGLCESVLREGHSDSGGVLWRPGGAAGGGSGSGYGGSSAGGGSEPYRYGNSGKDEGWASWEEEKREEPKPQGGKQGGGLRGGMRWDDSDGARGASKSSAPPPPAVEKPYSFSGDMSSGSGSGSAHGSKSKNSTTGDSWAGWDTEEDDSHQQKQSGYQPVGGGAKPNDSAGAKKDGWDDWGGF